MAFKYIHMDRHTLILCIPHGLIIKVGFTACKYYTQAHMYIPKWFLG